MEITDSSAINSSLHITSKADNQVKGVQAPQGAASSDQRGAQAETAAADPKAVQEAVEKFAQFMETVSSSLKISVDDDLSRVVLKVINTENDETIRQIPSEEVLELMKRMRDISEEFFGDTKGLLVESKV
ncbi:flagellar protein FlaG [Marinobacterium sp. YM272]|uniref:flagellar protein FlaG n=1 Tax=Marinobacterium sp. YM272 TaxID=3421654 RepID=UPI003D7FEDBA